MAFTVHSLRWLATTRSLVRGRTLCPTSRRPQYLTKYIFLFRLFGTTGYCSACNKVIPAFEMVMRARTNVYHLECFACQQCNHRLVHPIQLKLRPLGLFLSFRQISSRQYKIQSSSQCVKQRSPSSALID